MVDASINYLVASNGNDRRSLLRFCFGAEIGVSAEISFIFGYTNTPKTENLLCSAVFGDADIVILVAAGVALGCGMYLKKGIC